MTISGSEGDETWVITIVFRGFWSVALEEEWRAYQQQQRLILAPLSMEGLALAMMHKVARLHGGDFDLRFASGPIKPGEKSIGTQLTIALRLRRADRV
jgi:hypothetical protein